MAIGDRISRAEDSLGPALCAERPCAKVAHTEVRLLPGGRTERAGQPPQPLCSTCPHREAPGIRHVEVVLDSRGQVAQQQANTARVAPAQQQAAAPHTPGAGAAVEDGVHQGAEQARRPARRGHRQHAEEELPRHVAIQKWEDEQAAQHERRQRPVRRGSPMFDPADFGVRPDQL